MRTAGLPLTWKYHEHKQEKKVVSVRRRDFIDTAIYIDILFPDKVSIFIFYFKANLIEKSDAIIDENTEH